MMDDAGSASLALPQGSPGLQSERDLPAARLDREPGGGESARIAGPLVHIGYVKTGSSWLQRHLTNNTTAGFVDVGRGVRQLLVEPRPLWYDGAAVRGQLAPRIGEARAAGLIPVISNERLAGSPLTAGHDSTIIADRLFELFPDARILLVIREQRRHLLSIYNEYVKNGGSATLGGFLLPPRTAKVPLFDFRFLEFHRLVFYYQCRFGRDNVLVLPFESFVQDASAFCRRIAGFAGGALVADLPTDEVVRASLGAFAVTVAARSNHLLMRSPANPGAYLHLTATARAVRGLNRVVPRILDDMVRRRMEALIQRAVGDRYAESNRETAALTGLPLEPLGYST